MQVLKTFTDIPFEQPVVLPRNHATTGQRILNFIVDILVIRLLYEGLVTLAINYAVSADHPDFAWRLLSDENRGEWILVFKAASILFSVTGYYLVCEKLLKGRTLGKLITGTRAVKANGKSLTAKDVLLRTLLRLIPLDPCSGLGGHPWHDSWSGTLVIQVD